MVDIRAVDGGGGGIYGRRRVRGFAVVGNDMSERIRPSEAVKLDANGNPAHDRAKPWGDTVRMLDECQLDRLLYAGQIDEGQHGAGCRFRRRWISAHQSSGYGIRYGERVDGGGGDAEALDRLEAQSDVRAALAGMPETAALAVQAVCGEDEKGAGRMEALKLGLDRLAAFYGVLNGFKRGMG